MYVHSRSGLNLTMFRAYDARLGRWLSRDPIGESEGTNLYAYSFNSPLLFSDPLGLSSIPQPVQPYNGGIENAPTINPNNLAARLKQAITPQSTDEADIILQLMRQTYKEMERCSKSQCGLGAGSCVNLSDDMAARLSDKIANYGPPLNPANWEVHTQTGYFGWHSRMVVTSPNLMQPDVVGDPWLNQAGLPGSFGIMRHGESSGGFGGWHND